MMTVEMLGSMAAGRKTVRDLPAPVGMRTKRL